MSARPKRRVPARDRSGSWFPAAVAGALVVAAAVAVAAAFFVAHERWVYFWDWAGYWRKTIDLAAHLRHDVPGALATVLRTIRRDDYNFLAVLPLAPVALVAGSGRLAYVLSIVLLYGVTAAASLALYAERALLAPLHASRGARFAAGATIAALPLLWVPALMGLPDVAGCVVIPFVWWSLRGPLARVPRPRIVAAALLLALLVLLRRWYAYWAVALLVALGLEAVLARRGRDELAAAALRLAGLAAAALGVFLLASGAQGAAMLRTDYGALYAAYRGSEPLRSALLRLWSDFGPPWLALAAGGAALGLARSATRAATRVLLVQSAVVVVLFSRTQNFNLQHDYLVVPQVAVLAAACVAAVLDACWPRVQPAVALALAAALVVGFATMLVPGVRAALGPLAVATPARVYTPLRRDDLEQVAQLVRALDALTRDGNRKVYVLSSSLTLNEEVLANAHLVDPSLPALDDRVLPTSHVDVRDGFPWSLAMAHVVVLTSPVGYHLDPADQRVVGVPARELAAGTTIGRAYRRLPGEVVLDGGVRVTLYERTRELAKEDLDALFAELRAAHPGSTAFAGG